MTSPFALSTLEPALSSELGRLLLLYVTLSPYFAHTTPQLLFQLFFHDNVLRLLLSQTKTKMQIIYPCARATHEIDYVLSFRFRLVSLRM